MSVIQRTVNQNRDFEALAHYADSVGGSYVEVWEKEGDKFTMFGMFSLCQPSGKGVNDVVIKFKRITPPGSGENQPPEVDAFDAAAGGTCTQCGKEIYGLR